MTQYETLAILQKRLDSFDRVGEILASVRSNKLRSVQEVVDYYMNEWRETAALTRDELRRNLQGEAADLSPGGSGNLYAKPREPDYDTEKIIDSLKAWGEQLSDILLELQKRFGECFEKHPDFNKKLP